MPPGIVFMVVSIVLIAMVGRVLQERYRAIGRTRRNDEYEAPTFEARRVQDEVRQLKERIQVLERVITDDRKSIDLDREIDRLRDR